MSDSAESDRLESRIKELRSLISEEGQALDAYKATTAAALGVGVFLGLLALGGGYEIIAGNSGLWLGMGITRSMLYWVTGVLAFASVALFATAAVRERRRDRNREARLAKLEEELADLIDRKAALVDSSVVDRSRR
jgi:membrane protein implicated in regulation of membrane protease activity